ncbi:MAG TPA: YtxH domain-containing protein [Anaerolineales bacterium]|nr:YtxH domain-containing protein [Anaerolineales bacterium]
MRYIASFLVGAFVGGICALLFAPTSGEELRANIKNEADVQFAKAKDEVESGVRSVQDSVSKINANLTKQPAPSETVKSVA